MKQIIKHLERKISPALQRNANFYRSEFFRDISLSLIFFSYLSSIEKQYSKNISNLIQNPSNYINRKFDKYEFDDSLFSILYENSVISSFFKIISEDNNICRTIFSLWEDYFLDSEIFHTNIFTSAFNQVLEHTSLLTQNKSGSSYTPDNVVNLITQLLQPKAGENIYDPVCGTGGFLVSASTLAKKTNIHITPYGMEVNRHVSDIARMNLCINKLPFKNILTNNCFNYQNNYIPSDFDVVLANPPFSLKNWEVPNSPSNTMFEYGIPPKSNGDFAFIQHVLSKLNNKGRAGIIAPLGVLFRSGSESKIRKKIIESGVLEAVIQLPPNIFVGTTIGACVLLFKKEKTNKDILLVDASNEFISSKPRNILSREHIDKIVKLVSNQQPIENQTYLAKHTELIKNDYSLFFSNYFKNQTTKNKPINELYEKQKKLEKKLKHLQREMHNFR